jgi:hypothetical protein
VIAGQDAIEGTARRSAGRRPPWTWPSVVGEECRRGKALASDARGDASGMMVAVFVPMIVGVVL